MQLFLLCLVNVSDWYTYCASFYLVLSPLEILIGRHFSSHVTKHTEIHNRNIKIGINEIQIILARLLQHTALGAQGSVMNELYERMRVERCLLTKSEHAGFMIFFHKVLPWSLWH